MKKLVKNILFGRTPVTEYSTVTVDGEIVEKVFLQTSDRKIDISTSHWLLCLKPVIFGIWFPKKDEIDFNETNPVYRISFTDSVHHSKTVAVLQATLFNIIEESDGILMLLKIGDASVHHINFLRTRFIYHKYYKKPGQNFDVLKSYAAAYSYPRKVRIISFKEDETYTMFPMDLVGDIFNCRRYVLGLRHTNVVLPRIVATGKLVVSEVPYSQKDIIYKLGSHHRGPMSSSAIDFKLLLSSEYGFPLPAWAYSYKELKITKTLDLGSHMLLWAEEVHEKKFKNSEGHLFHVHFLHYLHQQKKGMAYPMV